MAAIRRTARAARAAGDSTFTVIDSGSYVSGSTNALGAAGAGGTGGGAAGDATASTTVTGFVVDYLCAGVRRRRRQQRARRRRRTGERRTRVSDRRGNGGLSRFCDRASHRRDRRNGVRFRRGRRRGDERGDSDWLFLQRGRRPGRPPHDRSGFDRRAGGTGLWGANGGAGADASLVSAVGGTTPGDLQLTQVAIGGGGGWTSSQPVGGPPNATSGAGGRGGSASSTLAVNDGTASSIEATVSAAGGAGGSTDNGTVGDGGAAIAEPDRDLVGCDLGHRGSLCGRRGSGGKGVGPNGGIIPSEYPRSRRQRVGHLGGFRQRRQRRGDRRRVGRRRERRPAPRTPRRRSPGRIQVMRRRPAPPTPTRGR